MTASTPDEAVLVTALRTGDEAAFATLVDRHTPAMLRVARNHVRSREAAEEVVQETWIALLKGIDKFEGRSSLRTWLFTVLLNIAKTKGQQERRAADVAALVLADVTVNPARFQPDGDPLPGHWKDHETPVPFPDTPEGSVLGGELLAVTRRELDTLPSKQRDVVTLRDVLGLESAEVCELLDITPANQRVLLHRGRAAVRHALEDYLKETS